MNQITNEPQIRQSLRRAAEAKKYVVTKSTEDLLYQKYIVSPPGTTYLAVVLANAAFLTKNCGTCG